MLELTVIIICLFLNALLASSETALIALNKPTLKALSKQGNEKAQQLLDLRENPERTLSTIQVGITFVGAFAAAIGGAGAEEALAPWLHTQFNLSEAMAELLAILIVVIPLTYATVVFGELVPKTLALRRSMHVASLSATWLQAASRILNPIVSLLEWSTKKIVNFFPAKHTKEEENERENDSSILESVSSQNRQYIMNMVKIERTSIKEIFVPWREVAFIEAPQPILEVEKIVISSGHTRLPVLKNNQVIGILNTKEFLAYQKSGKTDWMGLCRPVVTVQESSWILTALRLLQDKRAHMAIVFKGNQKTGIVTMEAIFEEIIGDIYDENDDGSLKKILSSVRFS
ncbi:MAG: hypothetical protein BGO14_08785 [Chlamydiales bacterium 38-26]|nr:HlyC/CorC family transporter [Chlamydiales bacterium]OJV11079.1 MAG: hypothetical protein BGO14_08785 [Chlamydiales bacterium 38-26]